MPSPPLLLLLLLLLLAPGAAGTVRTQHGQGEDGGKTLPTAARDIPQVQGMRERLRRGTEEDSKSVQQYVPGVRVEFPRPLNSGSLHPTRALLPSSTDPSEQHPGVPTDRDRAEPRANLTTVSDKRLQIHNPLYPVTESSYSAYAVMFLSLIVFTVGIIGNLSVMCIVWHNYYMKSAWNSILASLAFWDFLILFFCLPVVIFNEITKKRLLGDLSCRIVPFMEVRGCTGPRRDQRSAPLCPLSPGQPLVLLAWHKDCVPEASTVGHSKELRDSPHSDLPSVPGHSSGSAASTDAARVGKSPLEPPPASTGTSVSRVPPFVCSCPSPMPQSLGAQPCSVLAHKLATVGCWGWSSSRWTVMVSTGMGQPRN